jgi:hypothetical protein
MGQEMTMIQMTMIRTTMIRTTMIRQIAAAGIATVAVCLPAIADEATPDSEHGRYTFSKLADGFLRLDTQTGEVAQCSERTVGWACLAAPEDRAVLENEIARLHSENAALKQDILSRGLPLPAGTMPGPPVVQNQGPTLQLPSDADIDRMAAFVGRAWHRFVEAVVNAQKQVLHGS